MLLLNMGSRVPKRVLFKNVIQVLVAGEHRCEVKYLNDSYVVVAMDAASMVHVNGNRITGPVPVTPGDIIQLSLGRALSGSAQWLVEEG